MKILKSILSVFIALLMLFSLAACGEKEPTYSGDTNSAKNDKAEGFKETEIVLDYCTINVLGAEKIVDSEEKPAIRVWFDITNI